MQREGFEELQSLATIKLHEKFGLFKEHVEHLVNQSIEEKIDKEEAVVLSEDEERMLKEYRRFKCRSKPGDIFKWQTPENDIKIVTPEEPSLILDPRACC